MSADNGFLIWKRKTGKYEVREYLASFDYNSNEEMGLLKTFETLEEALKYASSEYSEYGSYFEEE